MACPLASERVWVEKSQMQEAERKYYEHLTKHLQYKPGKYKIPTTSYADHSNHKVVNKNNKSPQEEQEEISGKPEKQLKKRRTKHRGSQECQKYPDINSKSNSPSPVEFQKQRSSSSGVETTEHETEMKKSDLPDQVTPFKGNGGDLVNANGKAKKAKKNKSKVAVHQTAEEVGLILPVQETRGDLEKFNICPMLNLKTDSGELSTMASESITTPTVTTDMPMTQGEESCAPKSNKKNKKKKKNINANQEKFAEKSQDHGPQKNIVPLPQVPQQQPEHVDAVRSISPHSQSQLHSNNVNFAPKAVKKNKNSKSKGAASNNQCTLVSEIAKAREHIKNSLEKMDGIATLAASPGSADILDRLSSLEKDNAELHKLVESLKKICLESQKDIHFFKQQLSAPPAVFHVPAVQEKKSEPEDDDGVDLFASDEDEEETAEAAKIREERLAAYAAKKSKKPVIIAKSSLVLDVKPWDDETDLKLMETEIRKIACDGLLWGASKFVPVAFSIQKLSISCVVEDEKVSIDWLTEEIEKLEDYVQSVDVAAFNKI